MVQGVCVRGDRTNLVMWSRHQLGVGEKRSHLIVLSGRVGGLPCGPEVKILHSQCRGPRFNPWPGNKIPHATTKDLACYN